MNCYWMQQLKFFPITKIPLEVQKMTTNSPMQIWYSAQLPRKVVEKSMKEIKSFWSFQERMTTVPTEEDWNKTSDDCL